MSETFSWGSWTKMLNARCYCIFPEIVQPSKRLSTKLENTDCASVSIEVDGRKLVTNQIGLSLESSNDRRAEVVIGNEKWAICRVRHYGACGVSKFERSSVAPCLYPLESDGIRGSFLMFALRWTISRRARRRWPLDAPQSPPRQYQSSARRTNETILERLDRREVFGRWHLRVDGEQIKSFHWRRRPNRLIARRTAAKKKENVIDHRFGRGAQRRRVLLLEI